MGREIVVGLHFYQPPREALHPSLEKISTDPNKKNWTEIIEKECYEPLSNKEIINNISFDIYQSLLIQLEKIDPKIALIYRQSMRENGIGEAFIHPILPDLSQSDKSIIVSAGVSRFKKITGKNPKIFWPPETAIDNETLETLVDFEYQGFICAPEQIIQADGNISDNQPTLIELNNGKIIVAYPFDRSISGNLAFDPKINADTFAQKYIKPTSDKLPSDRQIIAWTDAETFGHHFKNGDKFLSYLLESSLPSVGLYPISINNINLQIKNLPKGKIVERSSWSCPHGNLIRWNGICDCDSGYDSSWKKPFSETMSYLNNEVSSILINEFGRGYEKLISENFYNLYSHPSESNNSNNKLILAKISSLVAKTSCATFFSNPEVSTKINLIYAYQSMLYLKEAGLKKISSELEENIYLMLNNINFPNGNGTAYSALKKMLHQ